MKHAEQVALDDQRDAEQRRDSFFAQDGVQDIGVIDVGDEDRDAFGRDPTREALAQRESHALLDLLLDPSGGARDELIRLPVIEQNRDRVDVERLLDAHQQFGEKRVERQFGQPRIAKAVRAIPFRRRIERLGWEEHHVSVPRGGAMLSLAGSLGHRRSVPDPAL